MAEPDPSSQLQAGTPTPIASLNPDIQDAATRVVRGVVTIVWPYSAFKRTVAFVLAEPDFLLRRDQGQVRIELSGPSAKAFSDAKLAGGHEVVLSLDGVDWAEKDTKTPIAGTPLPWQLKFKQRLLLQVADGETTKIIDINEQGTSEPEPEPEPYRPAIDALLAPVGSAPPPRVPTPEIRLPAKRAAEFDPDASEFQSPQFLKRARVSFGSLYEGGVDTFEKEATNGVAPKRTKTGRFSSVFRYVSESPSPEPEPEAAKTLEETTEVPAEVPTPLRTSQMVDGGCQTDDLEFTPPRHVEVIAEPRRNGLGTDETPSKPPSHLSQMQLPDHGADFGFGPSPIAAPYDSAPIPYPMQAGYPEALYGPAVSDEHAQHPQHLEQPSFAAHALSQHSYHTTPDSYHSPVPDHDPSTVSYYPAPDEHVPAEMEPAALFQPEPEPNRHSFYDQDDFEPERQQGGAHHTVLLDRIAEPPQHANWGFVPNSSEKSAPTDGEAEENAIEILSSPSPPQDTEGADADDEEDLTPPHGQYSTHAERQKGRVGALRDEEDDVSEEQDDSDRYGRTDSERPFGATRSGAVNTPGESASFAENDSDASGDEDMQDAGGDYDISHYTNLSHIQDDDDASHVESDYSQEDEGRVFNAGSQDNEDDEIDEDVEDFDDRHNGGPGNNGYDHEDDDEEEEDEEEEEEEEEDLPRIKGPPQVISLLSDSEDDVAPPPPRPQPSGRSSSVPQREQPDVRSTSVPRQRGRRGLPQLDGADDKDEMLQVGAAVSSPEGSASQESASEDSASEEGVLEQEQEAEDIQTEGHVQIPGHAVEEPKPATERESSPAAPISPAVPTSPPTGVASAPAEAPSPTADAPAPTADENMESPSPKDIEAGITDNEPTETKESQAVVAPESQQKPNASHHEEHVAPAVEAPEVEPPEVEAPESPAIASVVEQTTLQVTVTQVQDEPGTTTEPPAAISVDAEMVDAAPEQVATPPSNTNEPQATGEAPGEDADIEMAIEQPEDKAPVVEDTSPAQALAAVTEEPSPKQDQVDETSQAEKLAEPEPAMSFEFETGPADTADEELVSPQATQDAAAEATPEAAEEKAAPADEDATMQDSKVGLPTPDDTQLRDEEYSQVEIDLQLTQEAESTPLVSPKPTAAQGHAARAKSRGPSQPLEVPAATKANEKEDIPSTPLTKSAQQSLASRQSSEAPSSLDDRGPHETSSAKVRPRTSRARGKNRSEGADADPSVKLARASIASRRSTRISEQKTPPENVRVTRAASHNMMRSVSPVDLEPDDSVRLAKASLQSPSRQLRGAQPMTTARQLGASLRNDVPDCIPLKVLRQHPTRTVDVMAIVTTEPPEPKRAKSGPRGILLSFNVTDHSIAPSAVVLVNIFRANKSALPLVKPGDVVLLRQFTVTAMTGRGFGLRANDGSSWAVFDGDDEEQPPQIRGPPVELSKGDKMYAALLKRFYGEMDETATERLKKTNEKAMGTAEGAKG